MYEEEKKNSFIKDFIIKLLYMFLFLFLFMWLYPAPKVDLSDVEVKAKVDKEELQPLFAGVFNDNINAMKESAKSYYTVDRLPKTNGESTKMTLQEMLNKKMVAPFVDANGKSCNASSSYVEVTRISATEYTMKVNLVCSDKTDYIIETIGCTSVCPGCVATPASTTTTPKVTTPTNTVVYQPTPVKPTTNTNNNNTNNNNEKPEPTPETKTYIYEKEIVNETWELNNTWTSTKKTGNDVRLYDTRIVEGETEYVTKSYTYRTVSWVQNSHRTEDYTLILNSGTIPRNAKNVKISSSSRMTTITELNRYINNRYSCDIRMEGYGCPTRNDEGIIQNRNLTSTPIASFNYNLNIYKSGSQWKVSVRANATNYFVPDQQYIIPIKFTVKWEEEQSEDVKQYKYEYLKTSKSTDTKYSTSNNDTSLLNDGYKLVGTK